jgi:hypothetical protein
MIKSCFLALAILLGWLAIAQAQVWVNPYARRDGTQVQGHWRSNPDGNPYNNWSYPRNVNPYTGKQATGDPNRYLDRYYHRNDSNHGYNSNPYNFDPHNQNPYAR